MNKKTFFIIIVCLNSLFLSAKNTILGAFKQMNNQKISLYGFKGYQSYIIDSTIVTNEGFFKLLFSEEDYGMGYLISGNSKPFLIILCNENINLTGFSLFEMNSIKFVEGTENILFEQYSKEHPLRDQALSAWDYLLPLYLNNQHLYNIETINCIHNEIYKIDSIESDFLSGLNSTSYLKFYIPVRKLVASASTIVKQKDRIEQTLEEFRLLNYSDKRLFKSGLFKESIEIHFWIIENSGLQIDSVYSEMEKSIDRILFHLWNNEWKLNYTANLLFDYLEKRSLFRASEYLALKILNNSSCLIDENLKDQLEIYRKMKKGNIAPEVVFLGDFINPMNQNVTPNNLNKINSKYILLVFGASWCPKCNGEMLEISKNYSKWKSQDVEVVFISLDENIGSFKNFINNFPFPSFCDYKKWDGTIVRNYHVFSTPTFFLLDKNNTIVLRPISVSQMDAWVDWFIINRNK